jgi:hypothetical protein
MAEAKHPVGNTQTASRTARLTPEHQARELAASIDSAADDLRRNGPVSSAELRQMLMGLETEWKGEAQDTPQPERQSGRSSR